MLSVNSTWGPPWGEKNHQKGKGAHGHTRRDTFQVPWNHYLISHHSGKEENPSVLGDSAFLKFIILDPDFNVIYHPSITILKFLFSKLKERIWT